MSALYRVVPTLTEVVDEAVLEGREPRPSPVPHAAPSAHAGVPTLLEVAELAPNTAHQRDAGVVDLADLPILPDLPSADELSLSLSAATSPIAAQFLAQLPELSLDLPDLSLPLQAEGAGDADFLADTRVPGEEEDSLTQAAALPAAQELALSHAIDQAVDDALDEVLDQVLEKAVLALRAQLHSSVRSAVLRRLREQAAERS